MAENKIRVTTGIVVEVNDNGETITINVEDQLFLDRFYALIEHLEEIIASASKKTEMSYTEAMQYMKEETGKIMSDIDGLFGAESCRKIFGEIVPSANAIADFFTQLLPIAEKYASDRQKKISERYNRNRKGGHKYKTKEQLIQEAMGKKNV